ncbi:MAG: biotin/lipoyl-binding protein [Coriobacteriia bacterium]|nr:biotin/lipoyl-binding protein [Coriobacteriia bacterium]
MNRRNITLAVVGLLVVGLVVALVVRASAGPPPGRLLVAGDVRVNSRTVVAPTITTPTVDFSVGIPSSATPTAKAPAQPTRSSQPVVSGRLTSVKVVVGDHVTQGQVIAQLDTKLLDLGVKQAKANAARSRANTAMLADTLDTLNDALDKIPSARATAFSTAYGMIDAAIGKAKGTLVQQHAAAVAGKPQLEAGIAQLKAGIAQTEAAIAGLKTQIASLPPNDPQIPALKAKLAGAEQALAGMQKQLATLEKTLAGINTFLKQWPTILKTLATQTAAAKAKAGAAINTAIDSAVSKIHDAKTKVKNAKSVLKIISDSSQIGIDLAVAKRAQATILAPVSGVVTYAVPSGSIAIVGAPIVRIQVDGPALIDTYLTPEQLQSVRLGAPADITYDSAPGKVLHGTVAIIGTTALYPPTSFATDVVHMTRTIRVTIRLNSGDSPPQGTPVDISIHTN